MMRSLYSAITGLKNEQIAMDVIGNNIANVNTSGYKKSRTSFASMLGQAIRGASAPDAAVLLVEPTASWSVWAAHWDQ
ncbi:MAG: Flagellar hook protein FlgE [Candidatus Dichloromethanomonas elyunquensis]|nr:MAG: Flagellar hook protein FlgE [Candidatus Dichloromethanomonas elyunquensis]